MQIPQPKLTFILGVAFLLGGGGAPYPAQNMLVQVMCVAIACWPPRGQSEPVDFRTIDRHLLALLAASVLLPALQAMKLPPAIWTALPGRDLVMQSLEAIGVPEAWMSYSVDPARTLLAALSLIPAVATAILVSHLEPKERNHSLILLVGIGLAMIAIGAVQLASGNRILIPFNQIRNPNQLHGLFAYHNAAGIFLVICLIIVVVAPQQLRDLRKDLALRGFVVLIFGVGVVLTQSRSSLVLAILPLGIVIWKALAGFRKTTISRRTMAGVATAGFVGLVAVGTLLLANNKVEQTLARFENLEDVRPAIWEDSRTTLATYWPAGSGMGTFTTVFPIHESLENLVPAVTNRAHNDFLELGIEAGAAGYLLLGAWIVYILAGGGWTVKNKDQKAQNMIAVTAFLAIAGQSVIDYPLRNEAMLAVAGILAGLLARPPLSKGKRL